MANNPLLFPTKFPNHLRLADTRLSDSRSASLFQLKQIILRMFYGSVDPSMDVPTFYFEENQFSWTAGYVTFVSGVVEIPAGVYQFNGNESGLRYIHAKSTGALSVLSVPSSSETEQAWWTIYLDAGKIVDILPAKPGFGI